MRLNNVEVIGNRGKEHGLLHGGQVSPFRIDLIEGSLGLCRGSPALVQGLRRRQTILIGAQVIRPTGHAGVVETFDLRAVVACAAGYLNRRTPS